MKQSFRDRSGKRKTPELVGCDGSTFARTTCLVPSSNPFTYLERKMDNKYFSKDFKTTFQILWLTKSSANKTYSSQLL